MMKPAYRYAATLDRVVDGDTLRLWVDLGFSIKHRITVRLLGVNCPEMNTEAGKDARRFVVHWFGLHPDVIVETTKIAGTTDKYGRFLAVIEVDGANLATQIIADGYGVKA